MNSPPVHVTGAGVRLPPDLTSLDEFWRHSLAGTLLRGRVADDGHGRRRLVDDDARPAVGDALLAQIDAFDPQPFGLSTDQAETMDPQQRLLLETTWECLADAGHSWTSLRGQPVGVFVGSYAQDWTLTVSAAQDWTNAAIGTGAAQSILANRLSYLLDVHGPSLVVDTACSSSLTALHLAMQALRSGECERAIVAAVALGYDPVYRGLTRASLPVSATSRCRPFDAEADGIVRGEGIIVLLLERESVCQWGRHGRILGSAVNHSGRSNGITAPSASAQVAVMRQALIRADIEPDDVCYVEAHGTGTVLGDPIEAKALRTVYGRAPEAGPPCAIGSVKSSIGHTEAAAGLAGLLRALLVARHGIVPGQQGFATENPATQLTRHGLAVHPEPTPVPKSVGSFATAVSSIGFGGANAHVILGAPAPDPGRSTHTDEGSILALSAATSTALTRQLDALRAQAASLSAVEFGSLARRQSATAALLPHRAAWSAADAASLRKTVRTLPPSWTPRQPSLDQVGPILVFSGQGATWPAMGRQLWQVESLRDQIARWEDEAAQACDWSLTRRLSSHEPYVDAASSQICTYAVQLAIWHLLRSSGIRPAAVVGHSMGEVTAAVVSGALSSGDGFRILAARARALEQARGGAMLAVTADEQQVAADLAAHAAGDEHPAVAVAAVNGPRQTVISGLADDVAALQQRWQAAGIRVVRLPVDYAFHSPLLDGCAVEVEGVLSQPPTLPWHSTVTGEPMVDVPDRAYWTANLRAPVKLMAAVQSAVQTTGARLVIEVGPRPVLNTSIEEAAPPTASQLVVLASMQPGVPPGEWIAQLRRELFVAGTDVEPAQLFPGAVADGPVLPPAWERRRYWPSTTTAEQPAGPAITRPSERSDQVRALCTFIAQQVAAATEDYEFEQVPDDLPLSHWELSSLSVVSIRNAVERAFGIIAPLPLLLQNLPPRELAERLVPEEAARAASEPVRAPARFRVPTQASTAPRTDDGSPTNDTAMNHSTEIHSARRQQDQRYARALANIDLLSETEIRELLAELCPGDPT